MKQAIQPAAQQTTLSPAPAECEVTHSGKLKETQLKIDIKDVDNCQILDRELLKTSTKDILRTLIKTEPEKIKRIKTILKIEDDALLDKMIVKMTFYSGSVQIVIDLINKEIKQIINDIITIKKLTNHIGPMILIHFKKYVAAKKKLAEEKINLEIEKGSEAINKKFINDPGRNLYQDIIADHIGENSDNNMWIPNAPLEYNDGFEPNLLLNTYNCNQEFMQSLCSKPKTKAGTTKAGTTKAGTTKAATTKAATTKAATTKAGTTKSK